MLIIIFFQIGKNIVKSYEVILGFYGMKLKDKRTGKLERAKDYA